jgi:hypothetical protein
MQRLFLCAEQGDIKMAHSYEHAIDPNLELVGFCETLVIDLAVNVTGLIGCSPAKFQPKKYICDLVLFKRNFKWLSIELWMDPTVRLRAHIGNSVDVVHTQKAKEFLSGMLGVSNRKDMITHL